MNYTYVTSWSVTAGTLLQEEPDTAVSEDSLLHGEPLLVVASSDAEHVALELIAQGVSLDLLAHTLLIERTHLEQSCLNFIHQKTKDVHLQFISNFDQLLAAGGRKGQIDLHGIDSFSL